MRKRRAHAVTADNSPSPKSKTQTRAPAAHDPTGRRTAPLEARFRAAAEPAIIAHLLLGPTHSLHKLGLNFYQLRALQPLASSTICKSRIIPTAKKTSMCCSLNTATCSSTSGVALPPCCENGLG